MQVVDESGPGVSATAIAQAPPAREDGADQMPTADGRGADGENESPAEPYYWQPGGNPSLDFWGKLRHQLHFGGVQAISGAEAVGEVVANTMGLNDSKYQYVIDALEADKYRRERDERDEEDRRQMEEEQAREQAGVVDAQPADVEQVELGVPASTSVLLRPDVGQDVPDGVVDVPLN